MNYTIEKIELSSELTQLFISGELTLKDATLLKDELLLASNANTNFVLRFEGVSNIDLSVLQVVHAFKCAIETKSKSVTFIWNINEELKKLVEIAGYMS